MEQTQESRDTQLAAIVELVALKRHLRSELAVTVDRLKRQIKSVEWSLHFLQKPLVDAAIANYDPAVTAALMACLSGRQRRRLRYVRQFGRENEARPDAGLDTGPFSGAGKPPTEVDDG